MKKAILKKLSEIFITLFFVASLIFILMHFAPGSPFLDEHLMQNESYELLKAHYGLNQPLFQQYFTFLIGVAKGDFGPSLCFDSINVSTVIKDAFPISLKLGSLAFSFSIILGLSLSLGLAFSQKKYIQKLTRFLNTSCLALPSFVAAALLQYLFAIKLDLLPVSGSCSFKHLILPAFSLSLIPAGVIARLLKTKIEDALAMPYILSAKSKGLSQYRLLIFHIMPSALLPAISYLGPLAATLITGSFACEKVFAIPGLGAWFVTSLNTRDYPLIAGLTLFYSLFVLGFSFITDIVSNLLDPKLKKGSS